MSRDFGRDRSSENIWTVHDEFIENPEKKFRYDHSPLMETVYENSWEGSFLRDAPAPKECILFMERFLKMFEVSPSKHVTTTDVLISLLYYIDYHEPYFVLFDSPIRKTNDGLLKTYKHRITGQTLDPAHTEVFEYDPKCEYLPYVHMEKLLMHPQTQMFLRGDYIPEKYLVGAHSRGESRKDAWRAALIHELIPKMQQYFFAHMAQFDYMVEEGMTMHYEGMMEDAATAEISQEVWDSQSGDQLFWCLGYIAACTWIRGKEGFKYLVDNHQVYGCLFEIVGNDVVSRDRGNKVIVDGMRLLTLVDLAEIPVQAGTCEMCLGNQHCTKLINKTVLEFPQCSCGISLDPIDVNYEKHGFSSYCNAYQVAHPAKIGFYCQRCIYVMANKLDTQATKCGRTICPATNCKHHYGMSAHYAALNHRRTQQLTGSVTR